MSTVTPPRKRHKYRFGSRQQAEQAYLRADAEAINQTRLARALYADTITWSKRRGAYRVGVFDRDTPVGPRAVVMFHPDTGQELSMEVYLPFGDRWREMTRASYREPSLHECIAELLPMLA